MSLINISNWLLLTDEDVSYATTKWNLNGLRLNSPNLTNESAIALSNCPDIDTIVLGNVQIFSSNL
jgi:hypothetical protein